MIKTEVSEMSTFNLFSSGIYEVKVNTEKTLDELLDTIPFEVKDPGVYGFGDEMIYNKSWKPYLVPIIFGYRMKLADIIAGLSKEGEIRPAGIREMLSLLSEYPLSLPIVCPGSFRVDGNGKIHVPVVADGVICCDLLETLWPRDFSFLLAADR